ncbi:LysR family transcriptional regulator [Neptunicella marina]|uniref:LysR family transcriptional regulator n=1 Tax=Neptunicella marina TaxID=2125989 RepID=A0A8J6M1K3_9ALTE|nr:LysR family transcriptional regulator [Neptunicella marina]MBC3765563.1 LysR family transcriptional regulator [Neptunicella marina]
MDKELIYLLRVFCTVVEQGSFTQAAEKLHVQTPAISKAVSRLESLLNKRLLNRSTRLMETSDAGLKLYKQATEQLASIDAMLATIRNDQAEPEGTLHITATPAVGEYLSNQHIAAFCQQYPKLNIDMLLTNDLVPLPSQQIDIALRSSHHLEDSNLTSKLLMSAKRILVASPDFICNLPQPINPEQLEQLPCLHFQHNKRLSNWDCTKGKHHLSVTTTGNIACNSYSSLKQLCMQGMGIARLFDYQIEKELKNHKLVQVLPEYNWGEQHIYAVYHGKMQHTPKVKAFIEFIKTV